MNDLSDLIVRDSKTSAPHTKCVVRLTTSYWKSTNGDLNVKKTLRPMKRQCVGFNILKEDVDCIGAENVIPRIINLEECDDGLYQVVTCNESHDWETPHIVDDYDYKLIPYE